eukprot:9374693-Ditylum_brightwellii.AAC.1
MCRDIRKRHGKSCDYARLLERHCPLPDTIMSRRRKKEDKKKENADATSTGDDAKHEMNNGEH